MDTMTIGLAKELALDGIRVNAVRPGLIETDIHEGDRLERLYKNIPMQRVGQADEVAETILFLASDAAGYVNGSLVNVAGGRQRSARTLNLVVEVVPLPRPHVGEIVAVSEIDGGHGLALISTTVTCVSNGPDAL